jgi:hypothetical protein
MIKEVLAALGLTAAAGVPTIYVATRPPGTDPASGAAPVPSAQPEETIICPLTGEEISPCCCPLNEGN